MACYWFDNQISNGEKLFSICLYTGQNGLKDFIEIIKDMYEFDFIEFGISDIVRSDFVKQYILARTSLSEARTY